MTTFDHRARTSSSPTRTPGKRRKAQAAPDFAHSTLPWAELSAQQIHDYVESLGREIDDKEALRQQLTHWHDFGYAVLPGAVEPGLIDSLLADVHDLLTRHREFHVVVEMEGAQGPRQIRHVDDARMAQSRAGNPSSRLRIHDFIHNSIAAKKISLHHNVTGLLEHILLDRAVAFRSRTSLAGTPSTFQQDFAFVPAAPQSQLVGSYVALEDADETSGPLAFLPGSHRLDRAEWQTAAAEPTRFEDYLAEQSEATGIPVRFFTPKKGDVFLWHAALAHADTPAPAEQTRLAHVTHYAPARTHRYHELGGGRIADRIEYPGGFVMRHPLYPREDDAFRNGVVPTRVKFRHYG